MENAELQERIKKLPRVIRDYILSLEVELTACKKSLVDRHGTNTVWGWEESTKHGMACGYIPDDQVVRFYLRSDKRKWVEIRRMKKERLRVSGSHGLLLAFTSSNMMTLSTDQEGEWIE